MPGAAVKSQSVAVYSSTGRRAPTARGGELELAGSQWAGGTAPFRSRKARGSTSTFTTGGKRGSVLESVSSPPRLPRCAPVWSME
jgi:hypothetical protein